jgi:hypothetical protein
MVDHRPEDTDIESWDDALTRFETEFPDSVPDGVARVTDDTAPPDGPPDDATTKDGDFQLRGSSESTIVAKSGLEPGTDFPTGETQPDVLHAGDETVVAVTDTDADHTDNDLAAQPDEDGADASATGDGKNDDGPDGDAVTNEGTADTDGTTAGKEDVGGDSATSEANPDDTATTAPNESRGTSVTENQDSSNTDDKAPTTGATAGEDEGTKSDEEE